MKKILLVALAICLIASTAAFATVVGSLHDLGTGGAKGDVTSASTGQVCVFCHHPHRGSVTGVANAILWNITDWNRTVYPVYDSTESASMDASPTNVANASGTLAYASYFCMACHDGDIGANALVRPPRDWDGAMTAYTLPGAANLGTTLEDDHPVNFEVVQALFTDDGELRTPFRTNGAGQAYDLYPNTIQCATCHDVHRGALNAGTCTTTDANSCDPNIEFMMQSTLGSRICIDCHVK
jgi:hypothetical protein